MRNLTARVITCQLPPNTRPGDWIAIVFYRRKLLEFFSNHTEDETMATVAQWSRAHGFHRGLLVIKPKWRA